MDHFSVPDVSTSLVPFSPTLAEAFQLLASGKRNLLVNDVAAAVDALATSCQLFGEVYGEGEYESLDLLQKTFC